MKNFNAQDYFLIPKRAVQKTVGALFLMGALLAALHQLWLPWVGQALVVSNPPQKADAIVVLGGGNGDREVTGARLYKEGYAPLVFTTGESLGIPSLQDTPFAKFSADYLQQLGVPATAIHQIPQSTSTCDDARFTLASLPPTAKRIIVVTDPFHSRRAEWIFNTQVQNRLEVLMIGAAPSWFNPLVWWQKENAIIAVSSEYVKFLSTIFRGCPT